MRRLTAALVLVCACALLPVSADARPKQARHDSGRAMECVHDNSGRVVCSGPVGRVSERVAVSGDAVIIGGRPAGCPRRYCGCGLRKYLGINDKRLDLAWNWARLFPRAHPAPGMAVVWRHHVALIVRMTGHREAVLRDYNSGRGLSRIHVRSIAGAVIVRPSSRMAGL